MKKLLMKLPDLSKRPWRNCDIMIAAFLGLIDNLYILLSLGFCYTSLEMKYFCWRDEKYYRQQLKEKGQ